LLQWQEYLFICSVICSYPNPKITGESRGFAFVSFSTIEDAKKWLEMKQVEMLGDEHYSMAFSIIKIE
jgi:RNA recognition motif-containing protein